MRSSNVHWTEAAAEFQRQGEGFVLVTLLTVQGSAPRDVGTKMLVAADRIVNTIGGGQLEYAAIKKARQLLQRGLNQQCVEDVPLGAKLGQCCGGRVQLLYECFASTAVPVAVFGAGHVGRALIQILGELPVRVRWFDSREQEFPAQLPHNTEKYVVDQLADEVPDLVAGCLVVVLTHQHPLDYALVEAVLKRGDFRFLGVIGSQTKSRRFRLRLQHRGFTEQQIDRLHCPMGLPQVPGKHPMEVAVSIAGELIAHYQDDKARRAPQLPANQLKLTQFIDQQESP